MAGRSSRLLAFFAEAEPRRRSAAPSGWALSLDAAVAVSAAIWAVAQEYVVQRTLIATWPAMSRHLISGSKVSVNGVVIATVPLHLSAVMLIAAAMTGLPLAARRLYPITVWLAIIAAILVLHSAYVPQVALGTAVYAAYSAVVHSRYRNLAIAVIAVVMLATAVQLSDELPRFLGNLTAVATIIPAAAGGLGIRTLRRRLDDSAARLRRADAEHQAATARALAAERARIASELHDVVTHNVSVMIVQAGAARTVLASSPIDAEAALLAVEASGRAAMAELRNLLGLLSPPAGGHVADAYIADGSGAAGGATGMGGRVSGVNGVNGVNAVLDGADAVGGGGAGAVVGADAGGYVPLRPQPSMSELDALVGRVEAAGVPVTLRVSGEPRPLPPGADLAAYRVVQEALTNVLRHAGRAAVSVAVQWEEKLVITVRDSGHGNNGDGDDGGDGARSADTGSVGTWPGSARPAGPRAVAAPGRGLIGLRERLSLYGGELEAGPVADGGWQVRAVLPT